MSLHWYELRIRVGLMSERADLSSEERDGLGWPLARALGVSGLKITEAHLVPAEAPDADSPAARMLALLQEAHQEETAKLDPKANVAAYDQAHAEVRDRNPGKSDEWVRVYVQRMHWFMKNEGDMSGAPELPRS